MDRNSVIAILLIGLVLMLWPLYQKKVIGVKPVEQQVVQSEETTPQSEPREIERQTDSQKVECAPVVKTTSNDIVHGAPAETLLVENNRFVLQLSSLGGGSVIQWRLKDHFDANGDYVKLMRENVNPNLGVTFTFGGRTDLDLSNRNFDLFSKETSVLNGDTVQTIQYAYQMESGATLFKTFVVYQDRYDVDMQVKLTGMSSQQLGDGYTLDWNSGLASTEPNVKDDLNYYKAYAMQGGEQLDTKGKDTGIQEGTTEWVAIRSKYFIMALIPQGTESVWCQLSGSDDKFVDYTGEVHQWKNYITQIGMPLQGQNEIIHDFTLYMGPMEYEVLKAMDVKLDRLMNFGMPLIKIFSIPFYHALQFLYKVVGNYGWAIIIFAIAIKIVLYPLTRKSFQSMKAMQGLQPKIKDLQEKYKGDAQRLNKETMKLYKEEGVNPMGGCLPMLLQMPILIALFNLFRTTIMLRQAPFLMMNDLSAPDALIPIAGGINILPILMGVTMIVQQKLTVTDPKQKMMAYMMPIMFLFFFYKVSAGLNLYYLIFNLFTIAQELIVKRKK